MIIRLFVHLITWFYNFNMKTEKTRSRGIILRLGQYIYYRYIMSFVYRNIIMKFNILCVNCEITIAVNAINQIMFDDGMCLCI